MTDTASTVAGVLIWALLLYPVWSPRCRRIRKQAEQAGATSSTGSQDSVSRNRSRTADETAPAWEQDVPYALDLDSEDDL